MPLSPALRWYAALLLGLSAAQMTRADSLEDRMKACDWSDYDSRVMQFREDRSRLPSAIEVNFKSCEAGGPTYQVKAAGKIAVLQDVWQEGEKALVHSFAKRQPSPNYWIFEYQGWEWSGVRFVHKRTARQGLTPGNSCDAAVFHPLGYRAVIRCYPEYGADERELYHVALGSKVIFSRLQRNPPMGELTVNWQDAGVLTARFAASGKPDTVRTYRTSQPGNKE